MTAAAPYLDSPAANRGFWLKLCLCAAALAALCAVSLCVGKASLGPRDVWEGLLGSHRDPLVTMIVRYARLPSLVLSLIVGGALSVAGLLTQTLFRNPLATPSILGIGNGANLGLLIAVMLFPDLGDRTAVFASFAGALASAGVIVLMGISPQSRMDRNRLIVGGTMLGALEASLVVAVLFFRGLTNTMLGWTLGRLIQVDWAQVSLILPPILAALIASLFLVQQLEAFLLGDTAATSLGVRVGLVQTTTMLAVVVLAGAAVAAAGPVPYVGLIVPHIFPRNPAIGPRARLWLCLLGGSLLTGLAELLSRLASQRQLIPLGIWTMAMGAAFFFVLSLSRKGRAA